MNISVVLLNADYSVLGCIDWKKAIKLIVKKRVEVVKVSKRIIHNFENTVEIAIPTIVRLIKFIRALWRTKVPYSKRSVLIRDNFTCSYCGVQSKTGLSIDHVVPKSKGGKSVFENVVTSCLKCNNLKNDFSCAEAKMYPRVKPFIPTINQFLMTSIRNAGLEDTLKEVFGE